MAENDNLKEQAKQAVERGEDIRNRIRDVTLEALTNRRFDRENIREVVRAVSEGIASGAEGSRVGLRSALAEGLRGTDLALTKSVEAGQQALRQLISTGRGISDNELKQALSGLAKIGDDFVATVNQVADSASERVRPELRDLVRQSVHAGTETGRRSAELMAEFTLTGIEIAGEFGARFAQLAGGVLSAMAEALESPRGETNKPR